ncbi:hypothetical protein PoB_002186100 [Plakobranchus ocellatus]|uniref:Uncharacterized protein n=1 Tax=Plakobranchus ocellatus TaxID=259542 RepID=A0AAV3ZHH1_9GAST|nr:hypothetical protein PoB_002186100 [Plakobranchus ocellatus]
MTTFCSSFSKDSKDQLRLLLRQQTAFAEWVPEAGIVTVEASQGVAVNTVPARARQGVVASTVASSAEQRLERIDPFLRDLDEYLSSAVTITDEEQMDQGEENLFTQVTRSAEGASHVPLISAATSYAAVLPRIRRKWYRQTGRRVLACWTVISIWTVCWEGRPRCQICLRCFSHIPRTIQ